MGRSRARYLYTAVLILIYIYENMGYNNIWFAVHLIVMILAYFGGGRETVRRRRVRYVDA